jgi:hypothetical protein
MTAAKTILEMIESVDPKDTDKLDEIDARVTVFLHPHRDYKCHGMWKKELWVWVHGFVQDWPYTKVVPYTRSRDSLKQIRPKGWQFCFSDWGDGWDVTLFPTDVKYPRLDSKRLPTEELAELFAIIQAIEWERNIPVSD